MADQQQSPGLLANILAVAGFIILIVIIVWGAYHLLRLTGTGVSSLFSRFGADTAIEVTVPSSVQSGRAFPISWEYSPEENGSYAFLYQCKAGFRFDVGGANGAQAIPCGNAFVVGENSSLTVTPVLSGTSSLEVPISVVFMPSATTSSERPQGTATVNVAAASAPTAGTQTPPQNTGTQTSAPSTPGTPDLSVKVLAVGVIDASGAFIERALMSANEIAAVKFDIANNGTASTGAWYFTVALPMQQNYLYASQAQMSLSPGAHIENILRFRPVTSGGGNVVVNVDTTNAVKESNESNNGATRWVNAASWPYQYQAPYVY